MNEEMKQVIIKIFNLGEMKQEQQDQIIEQLSSLVFQSVMLRATDMLSADDEEALDALIDKNPEPQEVLGFLESRIPTLKEMVAEEIVNIKKESDEIRAKAKT